jgi:transcriptional regulator with XRE-family HTH domain
MEPDIRLNREVIVAEARKRRKKRGLTQQHLAALAKVGRSTLNRLENQNGDVTLSSVLRILSVLDMLDRKQEGSLILKRFESNAITAMFASNFGGGALEPKVLTNQESLDELLSAMDISDEIKRRAIGELELRETATIPRISLSQAQLEEHWPTQFACQA